MELKDYIKEIRRVEFHAHLRTHEAVSGTYHSAFKGQGMSFSECKPYEDGDDVRHIDWNATARQQGVFVRQFVEERELNVVIVLDLSETMHFGSIGKTKAEAAITAMSIIAFSALYNNDKVTLIVFDGAGMKRCMQARGRENVIRLVMEAMRFHGSPGSLQLKTILTQAADILRRRSLVFVISDFLSTGYHEVMGRLAHRHDVISIAVSDPLEHQMVDLGLANFHDLCTCVNSCHDTAQTGFVDGYKKGFESREDERGQSFKKTGLSYVHIDSSEDILSPIAGIFYRRAGHVQ